MITDNEKANAVRDYARQTNGSELFHRHGLYRRLIYTDGVKFMADTCGAHWLIDAIASHLLTNAGLRKEEFQVWHVAPSEPITRNGVLLFVTNGNDDVRIVTQAIEYSDFPRELMPFKLWAEANEEGFTLMLPEER